MTASGSPHSPGPVWPAGGGWPPPPPPPPPPPGYAYGFTSFAPPPPRRSRSGWLSAVIGGLIFVGAITFFGLALASYLNTPPQPSGGTTSVPSPQPTPEPSYHQVTDVPKPDLHPSDLPVPGTVKGATTWATQNRLYAQTLPVPTACTVPLVDMAKVSRAAYERHLNEVTACLWGVWHDAVGAAGYELPRPPVTVYSSMLNSPCGTLETQNAYFCMANQRIYYANDLYTAFTPDLQGQPFVSEMILAHEFGHGVQGRTGIFFATTTLEESSKKSLAFEYNRRLELQADCFAGHWLGAVAQSTKLSDRDRAHLKAAAAEIGLPQPDPSDDHGSSASRRNWLLTGMQSAAIASCNTYVANPTQVR